MRACLQLVQDVVVDRQAAGADGREVLLRLQQPRAQPREARGQRAHLRGQRAHARVLHIAQQVLHAWGPHMHNI